MIVALIELYRRIPRRPKCRCGNELSCSERALMMARQLGWRALPAILIAAQGCGTGVGNPPCHPSSTDICTTPTPNVGSAGN
jgi:hypothetical protein